MVNWALTSGIRSASAKPALTSCALTVSMTTARFTETVLPVTSTASVPSPVRTATSWVCASRFAATQACFELRGLDDPSDLLGDEVPDAAGERGRQRLEAVGDPRGQALGGQRVHCLLRDCLDVEPGEDLGRDPVDDRVLHGGVGAERGDALDVAVRVRDLVVRPGGDDRQRCEQRGDAMRTPATHGRHQPLRRPDGAGALRDSSSASLARSLASSSSSAAVASWLLGSVIAAPCRASWGAGSWPLPPGAWCYRRPHPARASQRLPHPSRARQPVRGDRQARALAFSASNSAWEMAPAASSSCAFAILAVGSSPDPATWRM